VKKTHREVARLNAICPYFTMFPLDFPLSVLQGRSRSGEWVLDPFCGRGTTNFAARLLGLNSLGVDASPVAVAITAAKSVQTTAEEIAKAAAAILAEQPDAALPEGPFWTRAYHPRVLADLSRLRASLLDPGSSPARTALRGIILGALHGPLQKRVPGYFSNQAPRTYAPKPAYAARFWSTRNLEPPDVDVLEVIARRARRFFATPVPGAAVVRLADSRRLGVLDPVGEPFRWVITSPPYYGMRTYVADQWLRMWFLGGPATVDYRPGLQLSHASPGDFASDLRTVWRQAAAGSRCDAELAIRFGAIRNRIVDPAGVLTASLHDSGWVVREVRPVRDARSGRRQADAFLRTRSAPVCEVDVRAVRA
jgi:hypothetical protein